VRGGALRPAAGVHGRSPYARPVTQVSRARNARLARVASAGPMAQDGPTEAAPQRRERVGAFDGVSGFFGMRWEDPQTVRLTIRPELINAGGLLSGVATYALVDYCMGSTLWAQTTREERVATISISINYIQTALEGELVCRPILDRRNRSNAGLRS